MPLHSATAVANEFLRRMPKDQWPSQIVVQKLVYIAHGWSLAITGKPLVVEQPEAWDNGPVFRAIWNHFRDFGLQSGMLRRNGAELTADLTDTERQIIDHVWDRYGHLSGPELSKMTHEPDTPWYKAYFGRGRNSRLSPDDIRDHYTALAMAGRGER